MKPGNTWLKIAKNGKISLGAIIVAPIFSLRTKESIGIGEFPDVLATAKWARGLGFSRFMTLPNNHRSSFDDSDSPYSALSLEALDPIYLRLQIIPEVENSKETQRIINENKDKIFKLNSTTKVDYPEVRKFKNLALRTAFADFSKIIEDDPNNKRVKTFLEFWKFRKEWLDEHTNFAALENYFQGQFWKNWATHFQNPFGQETQGLFTQPQVKEDVLYQKFLQWLADEQWTWVINECKKIKILIIEDLPYLPAPQSHDVYYHQDYYLLDLSAGALPDQYEAQGQKWGNYPRNHEKVLENPSLFIRPIKFMKQRGVHGFRADHVFGWADPYNIPQDDHPPYPEPFHGKRYYDLDKEKYLPWLKFMLEQALSTKLELGAENLGAEIAGVRETLEEFGVCGTIVFRWARDWKKEEAPFIDPQTYNSLNWAATSVHDSTVLAKHLWDLIHPDKTEYKPQAAEDLKKEALALARFFNLSTLPEVIDDEFYQRNLKTVLNSSAWQVMLPLADIICLDPSYREQASSMRINVPGTCNDKTNKQNWVWICPHLDEILTGKSAPAVNIKKKIEKLIKESGRV